MRTVPDRIRTAYRRLAEVRLLHHYWLDDGATGFDDLPEPDRTSRLLRYDVRKVLAVTPQFTGPVFRATGAGFVLAVPEDAVLDTGAVFDIHVTAVDPDLLSYTAAWLRPRPPVMLSNLTGVTRTFGGRKHLFLSAEYAAGPGGQVEDLVVTGGVLRQLSADQPGAPERSLGPVADRPVYLHQGDLPAGAGLPAGVLAVVRLAAVRPGDPDFSLVGLDGRPPATPPPVFEVRLKNRATVRRYRKRSDGTVTLTEADPSPLTWFGNAGPRRKPAAAGVVAETDPNSPGRVARLVSDIFI
ncbi:hypothetical protein [Actinoplanes sp. NPDC026670]|uniref:hypothetical protein n=1 Tax=Actinoplanes sp. NPDC026670 TaxID=3154700 RepID=UPI0033DB0905